MKSLDKIFSFDVQAPAQPGNRVCHKLILSPQQAALVGDWMETQNGRKIHHFFLNVITMNHVFTNCTNDCGKILPGICMIYNAPQWWGQLTWHRNMFDSQPCPFVSVSLSKTPFTQLLPTAPVECRSHVKGQRQRISFFIWTRVMMTT